MIYMRGQAGDYDHWADLTDDASWRWDKVLPLFKQSEDYYGGASENMAWAANGAWKNSGCRGIF